MAASGGPRRRGTVAQAGPAPVKREPVGPAPAGAPGTISAATGESKPQLGAIGAHAAQPTSQPPRQTSAWDVVGPAINDIQRRLANDIGVFLASGARAAVKEAIEERDEALARLAASKTGRDAEDAALGDAAAAARLNELQVAAARAQERAARAEASVGAEEASDLREVVGKVLTADAAPVTEADLRAHGVGLAAAVAADDSLVCEACGNNDPLHFVEDSRAGELTCRRCGRVASQRRTLDGDWTRGSLAEDGDKTQQGAPQQRNYSSQWNLRTAFSAPLGVSKSEIAHMRRMAAAMERGQESASVSTGQRTTAAYKDKMKSTAFAAMDAAGERLGLHRAVTDAAKDLFTRLRDQRENMHRFKTVILACLAISCARAGISAFDSALEKSAQAAAGPLGASAASADAAAAARFARIDGAVVAPSAASAMPTFLPDTDPSLDEESRRRAAAAMRSAEAETTRKHRLSRVCC
ncbi:hypothetical protein FNF29_07931 [Cafeteria roenbergensis]|uniref:General transcription factor TFIIB n=1 Tax=Cafeteria roenbergensis TaxID=33653 RepID=A0A5A8C150_CAFRO|nr:hypothetical protein FNF29_07931 [Cafeteria roenbergensis]|eukprot:KAA0146598.1 hypothetical protein FNF29_07931 [Cafeteria roenbergensis]